MIPRRIILSDAWATVVAHLTSDLLALRERNDSRLGAEETAYLRGTGDAVTDRLGTVTDSDWLNEPEARCPPRE